MLAGWQASVDRFIHGAGHARQFANNFIQAGKTGFNEVPKIAHPLHGSVIPESIREYEDNFAHKERSPSGKKKATKSTEVAGKLKELRALCG
jgi:hypothetical protein